LTADRNVSYILLVGYITTPYRLQKLWSFARYEHFVGKS